METNFIIIFSNVFIIVFFNFFILINHPLFLRLLLILITIIIITRVFNSSFNIWFSFILCIIYLGGVLILFIYISSFLPNKKFISFSSLFLLIIWRITIFFLNFNLSIEFFSIIRNRLFNFNILFLINKFRLLRFSIFYLIFILLISVYYSFFKKIPLRRVY